MWKWIKRNWKNIALVMLACHFVIDSLAYANLGYTIYKLVIV
jgi:hypothetical protein